MIDSYKLKTWWGQEFIKFFDKRIDNNRKIRGKRYVKNGNVITANISENTIHAQVKGNRLYDIYIEFPMWDGKDIELVFTYILSGNYLGKLLNGEFPEELHNYLKEIGINIFDFSGIKYRCSCPDSAKICKHIYAVLYSFAKTIERIPAYLLSIRGVPLGLDIFIDSNISFNDIDEKIEEYPYGEEDVIKGLSDIEYIDLKELQNISFSFPKLDVFRAYDYDLFGDRFGVNFRKVCREIKKIEDYLDSISIEDIRNKKIRKFRDKNHKKLLKKIKLLTTIKKDELKNYNKEIQFSYFATKFCLSLIKCGGIIPKLYYIEPERTDNEKSYTINWEPFLCNDEIKESYEKLIKSKSKEEEFTKKFIISHILNSTVKYIYSEMNIGIYDIIYDTPMPDAYDVFNMFFYLDDIVLHREVLRNLYLFTEGIIPRFSIKIEDIDGKFIRRIDTDNTPLSNTSLQGYVRLFKKEFYDIMDNPIIDGDEFYKFLFKKVPKMMNYGINIILPKNVVVPKIRVDVKTTTVKHYFSFKDMLSFNYKIDVDGEYVDLNEFIELIKKKEFAKFKNKYIILNEKILKKIRKLSTKRNNISILFAEDEDIEVNLEDKVKDLLNNFQGCNIEVPNLNVKLRNYQMEGFKFLYKNVSSGFGCLLADDMGLGKTVQTIAVIKKLLSEENNHNNPNNSDNSNNPNNSNKYILIIVPTALITNWIVELKKFGNLDANIVHSSSNIEIKEGINITTYGIIRRHIDEFKKIDWDLVVLDEAQNIKNPNAKQTKAVKKLKAKGRIALTGTPIENRLTDFWSIFDFLNKGYLGSLREFKEDFAKPIEVHKDEKVLKTFKKMISPFVLRREKTDKNIIKELPSKIRINKYAPLTKEQILLYKNCLNEIMEELEKSEGIKRKGLVLKLILNLKQICNHPSLYLKDEDYNLKRSGKSMLLMDILEDIYENNEKSLIFTQYREMGHILKNMLEEKFNEDVLFYHGNLKRNQRDELIDKFKENGRFLILTYKAGGVGLNLTEANNIIHYDLWWNPSVERQGEDRTYRIGQYKDVIVYRLITSNTFEEKIDNILKEKEELCNLAMVSGGKFILDMPPKELKELFKLGV